MKTKPNMISRRTMIAMAGAAIAVVAMPPVGQAPAASHPAPLKGIKVETVIEVVGRSFGVNPGEILSPNRSRRVVDARQHAMYVADLLTMRSLPELGRRFGGRDHTTVLHAIRKIDARVRDNAFAAADADFLIDEVLRATLKDGGRIDWARTKLASDESMWRRHGAQARGFADKTIRG
jgi:hypothetical protein